MNFRFARFGLATLIMGSLVSYGIAAEPTYFKYKSSTASEHRQLLLRSVENPHPYPITAETQDHEINLESFCRGYLWNDPPWTSPFTELFELTTPTFVQTGGSVSAMKVRKWQFKWDYITREEGWLRSNPEGGPYDRTRQDWANCEVTSAEFDLTGGNNPPGGG